MRNGWKDRWERATRRNKPEARRGQGADGAERNLEGAESPPPASSGARRTLPIGLKLFLTVFASILACVLAMGQLSYGISKSIIEQQATDSSSRTLKQLAEKLELVFGKYNDIAVQFVSDTTLQNMIGSTLYADDEITLEKAQRELNNKIQSMVIGLSGVENLNLIPLRENLGSKVLGTGALDRAELEKQEWYRTAIKTENKSVWIPTQPSGFQGGGKPSVGLVRALREPGGTDAVYLLLVEIQDTALQDQLKGAELGEGSAVSILDGEDRVLLDSAGREAIGKPARVEVAAEAAVRPSGSLHKEEASGEALAIYERLPSNGWILTGVLPVDLLVKEADAIYRLTFIVSAAAALLAALIGLFVMRLVGLPLQRLRSLMQRGREGDLTVRAQPRGGDVIGQTETSFNEMMAQITELVRQARGSSDQVLGTAGELGGASRRTAEAAKEIATASEEIAGGAASLAGDAERGSDLTLEMSRGMEQLRRSNSQMGETAARVEASSRRGADYMTQLVEKTAHTESATSLMAGQVESLQESTRSIRQIMDVLGGVAKQTNILSLNASIEAARAGAAGKGFMVVAAEIRQLSEQSRQSIALVETIIGRIQQQIAETASSIGEAKPMFQQQIHSVKETSLIFQEVQGRMGDFADCLNRVGESVDLLDGVHAQLSEAMSSVSAVSQQASATSEEVASLTQEQQGVSEGLVELSSRLEGVSRSLQAALARFRTD
ncbi:methyl-accepting chemotaxis protein [Paenibacillus albicereus]|uniref:Methyl-accepting chemotaxis protein n=1 Tax=Paenibacillus albicereus TaxID=2726185 RepID=A0A6H2GZH0_9BACL|nr:methyl-accepting chemotaxis protein [Paenibacillus albicereus]QJC52834.1 methyl-accepting chemotaxis protein [Paenibacillus albicereus]